MEGKELDIVNHAKILGVTVSNNLLWNNHINDVIRKANKRLYFIVLLKRARLPAEDIIRFYCTCIRPASGEGILGGPPPKFYTDLDFWNGLEHNWGGNCPPPRPPPLNYATVDNHH